MMRRRSKRRALKWLLWIGGVLGTALITLYLIKIDDVVMGQGIVDPGQKIYIDSPMTRVIQEVYFQPGAHVKAGQPLARLYDGDLSAAVASAERDVQRAEANLEVARAQLELLREKPTPEELKIAESRVEQAKISLNAREQELTRAKHLYLGERLWSQEDMERARTQYELAQASLKVSQENYNLIKRGASPAELQEAEAEVRQSQAALAKARHTLEAARETLERATLRSPVDGVVARRDLHPGMLAGQGQIVMIVAGKAVGSILDAWVPETNAWKVRLGQPVEILSNLFADREEFLAYGEVSQFYGYGIHEGGARTFELEVKVVDAPLPLKYGSTADLRIIVGRRSILKILLGIEDRHTIQAGREHPEAAYREPLPDSSHGAAPPSESGTGQTIPKPAAMPDTGHTDSKLSAQPADSL